MIRFIELVNIALQLPGSPVNTNPASGFITTDI